VPEIRIRSAEPGDAEAIFEILDGPVAQANTMQPPWVSVEERRQRVAFNPDGRHLVATIDGRVVGEAGLHLQQQARRRDVASIGMAVHDDFAGQGVGTALLRALIDLADNWYGLRRLELTVFTDNAAAVHLYEKCGFVVEGTAKGFALRAGQYVDAYYMARVRPSSANT